MEPDARAQPAAPPYLNAIIHGLLRAPVWIYHWRCGWVLGRRFLLLIHTGRRTGRTRRTVLEVMQYRPETSEAIVMCAFGENAGWLRNIRAMPAPDIVLGARRFAATFRVLSAGEAEVVIGGL